MNHQPLTIVLTGGGSGGHITPLLSLARELKAQNPNCQIVYVGHKGDNFDSFKNSSHDFDFMVFINAGKFRRYHSRSKLAQIFDLKTLGLNIRDMLRLPGSIISSLRIMSRFKPAIVFSKGGFVAVPVGVAAKLRRVPIVTHDSDAVPGLANRIVGRWAKVHATGLPAKYYAYPEDSVEQVGIPIDQRIKKVTPKVQAEYKKLLKIPPDSQVLLLSGGGNGSQRLNELLVAISRHLLESNLALELIHMSGQAHEAVVRKDYKSLLTKSQQSRVLVKGYSSDFYAYSAAADLIITRAGASTLAELATAGKACIVIPSPYLTGGHQLKNAEELASSGAAVVVDQTVEPDELLVIVSELLANDHRRFELARNLFATAHPDAAAKLAAIILKTAQPKASR
ncbi:UDP-N-acetylglucosamine--N-acetylmuramyl-(pentapeptide) pyrophosphoryl-undecaprenol N-acetylglucosamine transferase [Candidatus Saccharibacteria bacterium]|nr:UDP-N-acetylglucosamine--N-acetylmuramyl-(pentapeptide) pyrophosphoryl-undecaprenol N-acetylglucosamine transferase [Candidatus Saccharibacteria bacterium]